MNLNTPTPTSADDTNVHLYKARIELRVAGAVYGLLGLWVLFSGVVNQVWTNPVAAFLWLAFVVYLFWAVTTIFVSALYTDSERVGFRIGIKPWQFFPLSTIEGSELNGSTLKLKGADEKVIFKKRLWCWPRENLRELQKQADSKAVVI